MFVVSAQADDRTLHAILIGDTASNLNIQSKADLQQIQSGVGYIANSLKIKQKVHVLKGNQVTSANILRTLKDLSVKSDDLVLFYFTGHGFNYQKSRWPSLFFFTDDKSMDLETVISVISEKKPRFALVMADCCNVSPYKFRQGPGDRFFTYDYEPRNRMNTDLDALFLKSTGILVISASSPGEFSWANENGGIFTNAFLDSFGPAYGSKHSWQDLLRVLSYKTQGIQTPQYKFLN